MENRLVSQGRPRDWARAPGFLYCIAAVAQPTRIRVARVRVLQPSPRDAP